ncbi:hypothetical protein [Domibacillus indicus]|uniref:hypothetical protein n=1 Tax=Domibacillus indicus TaxID=1437523 RepID=UPI000617DF73|nr:hypothetical protein [Domibacillus indicus]
MIEHKNLSLHLSKEQLKSIVHELAQQHYLIFWGFDRGTMILNVYHAAANNQFSFIRHRSTMELIYAKIVDEDVLDRLNRSIQFTALAEQHEKRKAALSKEIHYQTLDYYLSELHEYIKQGNTEKIEETKAILASLTSDAS